MKHFTDILSELRLTDISPTTESAFIPFKDIGTEDRVAFYSRCRTLVASFDAIFTTMLRCRQKHYKLVATYVDADEYDMQNIRPELQMMLADAHNHKFDVLAVPGPDRISRDPGELIRIISELQEQGVRIALMNDALKSPKRLASKPNRKASS